MNLEFNREAQEAVKKISWWQRFRMTHFPPQLYIGHEKREGWSGPNPFYLFWCNACKHIAKDYPHGHGNLLCSNCGARYGLVTWKDICNAIWAVPAACVILAIVVVCVFILRLFEGKNPVRQRPEGA